MTQNNDLPEELAFYEPEVTLSLPSETGYDPVRAVESFINHLIGSSREYVYTVNYGPKSFLVDMANDPPIVKEV